MQTCRRIFAVLTALLAAAVLLAGCSSKKEAEPLPDAAALIKQSAQTTKSLDSAHLQINVTGKIDGLPIKTLNGDLTNIPAVAVQGKAMVSLGGSDVEGDLVVIDGTLYAALSPNNWLDMGPAADIYDPGLILNPDSGLAHLLSSISEAKAEGFETVGGVSVVKISGKVTSDAVNKLIPQIKATGPVPATVWIEKDAPNQLVQAQVEPSSGNTVAVTLSDWDKPVTVTKPAM